MNKVTPDLESALARVKNHAVPSTPCGPGWPPLAWKTASATTAKSPSRICNMWSIIEGHIIENRIHLKLVGEDLGY
ncbi:MAG: LUD domain-containing protein [Desulfobaccales bacterium]